MKKILCYGDSNTFGFNPEDGSRYDDNNRWSGILKTTLQDRYVVIEEGLNNRTGFVDNPNGFNYSSILHFPKFTENLFVDVLILAIGTNDLQFLFNFDCKMFEAKLTEFINLAKTKSKQIILIPPVIMLEDVCFGSFSHQFDKTSILKAKQANEIYKRIVVMTDCHYFDFNEFVKPSKKDGLHYDNNSHKLIAQKLTEFINKMS